MQNMLAEDEYASSYSSYVKLVPDGDIIQTLAKQMEKTIGLLLDISDEQAHFRYAPGKWTIKEVIGHMADTERVMAYRLLAIARGDTVSLPGFDDKEYAQHASFDKQSVKDLLQNLNIVRQSTIHLIKSLTKEDLLRRGTTNNTQITVRALIAIIAGHELHHCNIIRDRYFGDAAYPKAI